jgi:hypothetical protein
MDTSYAFVWRRGGCLEEGFVWLQVVCLIGFRLGGEGS